MKAMLYMQGQNDPVAVLDEVQIVTMNDNHKAAPQRVLYKARRLNAGKTLLELHRDAQLTLKLEDGRDAPVVLQHSSLDMQGNAVGVLRVLGTLPG
jgi:hypothetical protein